MAFCNACGASLDPASQVCPKCGAAVPVTTKVPVAQTPAASAAPSPAPPRNALRTVLIVVGAVVVLGIAGTVIATLIGLHIAKNIRVEQRDGKVRVQGPFGTVETTEDAEDAARNLGVDAYPGARIHGENASTVDVGGTKTVAVELETGDPPDKVAEFYRSKLPSANVNVNAGDHYSIVSTEHNHLVTINIEPAAGKTLIHISEVSGKGVHGSQSSD